MADHGDEVERQGNALGDDEPQQRHRDAVVRLGDLGALVGHERLHLLVQILHRLHECLQCGGRVGVRLGRVPAQSRGSGAASFR